MARPLTKRELSEEILFGPRRTASVEAPYKNLYASEGQELALANGGFIRVNDAPSAERSRKLHDAGVPHLVPVPAPKRSIRKAPLMVRINRLLQTALLGFCGLALVGYGFDVTVSKDVTTLEEQARRLSEQNTELSAELLKSISFQGIQESALGSIGLRPPDHVLVVQEKPPLKSAPFKANRNHLPLMSGY